MPKLGECQMTSTTVTRINRGTDYVVMIDDCLMFTGTKKDIEGVLDFLKHGYSSKLLNNSQKN